MTRASGGCGADRRGALLLECLLAAAVLAAFGIAILGIIGRSQDAAQRSRWEAIAADLARSAMAKIESGAARAESLQGPAYRTLERSDDRGGTQGQGDASLWELDIQTEVSEFEHLTHVAVRAYRKRGEGSKDEVVSYTMHQLVRLDQPQTTARGGER
jgi:Tfp pilus assembly protein PilV